MELVNIIDTLKGPFGILKKLVEKIPNNKALYAFYIIFSLIILILGFNFISEGNFRPDQKILLFIFLVFVVVFFAFLPNILNYLENIKMVEQLPDQEEKKADSENLEKVQIEEVITNARLIQQTNKIDNISELIISSFEYNKSKNKGILRLTTANNTTFYLREKAILKENIEIYKEEVDKEWKLDRNVENKFSVHYPIKEVFSDSHLLEFAFIGHNIVNGKKINQNLRFKDYSPILETIVKFLHDHTKSNLSNKSLNLERSKRIKDLTIVKFRNLTLFYIKYSIQNEGFFVLFPKSLVEFTPKERHSFFAYEKYQSFYHILDKKVNETGWIIRGNSYLEIKKEYRQIEGKWRQICQRIYEETNI
ncbi:MAG: hypothetical protein HeimC3_23510 [Candidatus Heimdallarchaeota archaeon LC_3]|nr:MAG: hypothetical protein HeimC3_23510 [Candidatus Heimdallarchaeota archaeon LC_3]